MSHFKREFEGDIMTAMDRIKVGGEGSLEEDKGFDFLQHIKEDYGISHLGGKVFGVEINGKKYEGNLASIFDVLRDGNKI